MTCEYCDGKTHQLAPFPGTREYYDFLEDRWVEEADSLDGAEVAIGKDKDGFAIKATAWFDNGYVSGFTRVPIKHCPMCGRDLGGDEQ